MKGSSLLNYLTMSKKPYIVSIHSHGGSMREASGDHNIVEMADEEAISLYEEFHGGEIASETGVIISPITEIIDYKEMHRRIRVIIEEGEYEEDESDLSVEDDGDEPGD